MEPEREAPYEGELPEQAEAAQPEQPDSEQPSEPAADPAAPDDASVTDAQKTAQAALASMTEDEKLWQLFFVTPEAITNVNTATVAGEATKNALAQYPVGGIVYFAKNLEDRAQAAALLANTQSYAKIPLFLGVDEEGGTVSRIGANEALGGTKINFLQEPGWFRSCARRSRASSSRVCGQRASSPASSTSPATAAPRSTITTARPSWKKRWMSWKAATWSPSSRSSRRKGASRSSWSRTCPTRT